MPSLSPRSRRRLAAPAFAVAILLAGCGSSDALGGKVIKDGIGCAPVQVDRRTDDVPKVEKLVDPDPKATDVTSKDLMVGKGCGTDGGTMISLDLVGATGSDGKVFTDTFAQSRPITVTLGSGQLIPGLENGLTDMKVGGRREFTIPPGKGYGSAGNPDQGIGGNETLVFVVDLVAVSNTALFTDPPTTCNPTAQIPPGPPGSDKPTEVAMPEKAPVGKVNTIDLKEGTGDPVKTGNYVTLNYLGISCLTGKQFDSSWDRGKTFPVTLGDGTIPGFAQGIEGMKVGGLRQIEIPPDLGYGIAGQPPDIAPNDPLIFVIQVVASADAPPATTTTVPAAPADPGASPTTVPAVPTDPAASSTTEAPPTTAGPTTTAAP